MKKKGEHADEVLGCVFVFKQRPRGGVGGGRRETCALGGKWLSGCLMRVLTSTALAPIVVTVFSFKHSVGWHTSPT